MPTPRQSLMSCLDALVIDLNRAKTEIVDVRSKLHHIEAIVDNALSFTAGNAESHVGTTEPVKLKDIIKAS